MKNIHLLLFVFTLSIFASAQTEVSGYKFGSSSKDLPSSCKDVSNPQGWEETAFEIEEIRSFLGFTSSKTLLTFYKGRLADINLYFPIENYEELKKALEKSYELPLDTTQGESVNYLKGNMYYYLAKSGDTCWLSISDNAQKEFHFKDLFQGVLLWIIVTIIGLFVVNWLFAWMINSFCKACKSFGMEFKELSLENYKDYSLNDGYQFLERPDFHHDKVYKFQCKKCGHIRSDRYSGFWSWLRSKE